MGTAPNGPGYTGHVNDPDTGLVYMQARYYDPGTGRFLSVDPVNPEAGHLFSFNRYNYANNNPIINIDSDGRQTLPPSTYQTDWRNPETRRVFVDVALSVTPVISDVQNISDAFSDPTALNVSAAIIGAAPEVGGLASKALKEASAATKAEKDVAKVEKLAKGPRFARGELRQQVLDKGRQADGSVKCAYCDKPTATQSDHVVAHSKGGATTIENLEPSCASCNASKGAKELGKEWVPPKDRE